MSTKHGSVSHTVEASLLDPILRSGIDIELPRHQVQRRRIHLGSRRSKVSDRARPQSAGCRAIQFGQERFGWWRGRRWRRSCGRRWPRRRRSEHGYSARSELHADGLTGSRVGWACCSGVTNRLVIGLAMCYDETAISSSLLNATGQGSSWTQDSCTWLYVTGKIPATTSTYFGPCRRKNKILRTRRAACSWLSRANCSRAAG